jgi:hypothetical protein
MALEITSEIADKFRCRLEQHPIYAAVASIEDLHCFMQHHVYSVWDFMSLIKYLQAVVAPARQPWSVVGDASARRFINELVLEEESDENPFSGGFCSHFELYQQAMLEIGADTAPSQRFVERVEAEGIAAALAGADIPEPARRFTAATFAFIDAERPHVAAAALALGREHIIPAMFRAILRRIGVGEAQAPIFHTYLNRHIHLDEDFHAPLSLRLLNGLCANDQARVEEAVSAAEAAVHARLDLWDGVYAAVRGGSVVCGGRPAPDASIRRT